jgi:hypothetical protein
MVPIELSKAAATYEIPVLTASLTTQVVDIFNVSRVYKTKVLFFGSLPSIPLAREAAIAEERVHPVP